MNTETPKGFTVPYDADPQIARWLWHPSMQNAKTPKERKSMAQYLDYMEKDTRRDDRFDEESLGNKDWVYWVARAYVQVTWYIRYTLLAPWLGK